MAGEDDLHLRADLDDAVSGVLERIEARLDRLEVKLAEVNAAGRAAGAGVDEGMAEAEASLGRTERQADKTTSSTKKLGDETSKSGKKTDDATSRWDRYEKKLAKVSKTFGGFSWLTKSFKWATMISGAYAAAAGVSALGAGAVEAIGGLARMGPGLAAILPIIMAFKLGSFALTQGLKAAAPQVTALKAKFADLGKEVASGGLAAGLTYMTKRIDPFVGTLEGGFHRIGSSLGFGAEAATDFITQTSRMQQVQGYFEAAEKIIDKLIPGVLHLAGGMMNLLTASLPAGVELSGTLSGLMGKFDAWTEAQLRSGKAQQVITDGLHKLEGSAQAVWNFLVGLVNIFRIGSTYSDGMGASIQRLSQKFRDWTTSVTGQNAIRDYFAGAQPVLHELMLLLGDIFKMFGGLANNTDLAPIIAQIRTQLLPVIATLLSNMSGTNGLLPAIISIASSFGTILASVDPSTFTILADAIKTVADGIAWLTQNVPGAQGVLSTLFTGLLLAGPVAAVGEKVSGIVEMVSGISDTAGTVVEKLGDAKEWWDEFSETSEMIAGMKEQLTGAVTWTKNLVAEGGLLAGPWNAAKGAVISAATWIGGGLTTAWGAVRTAALTAWDAMLGPIGLIILAVIAVIAIIVYLWNNCEWFRDAVTAVWEWIKNAAIASWNLISQEVTAAIQVIAAIATWLWQNVIQPVWDGIVAGAKVAWAIISFIVGVAVFIIVAIITMIAIVVKAIWDVIAAEATFAWQNVILPIIQFVADIAVAVWNGFLAFITLMWSSIVAGATWAWVNVIQPLLQGAANFAMMIWQPIAAFFTWLWSGIVGGAQLAWTSTIQPIFAVVAAVAMAVWKPIGDFFTFMWGLISSGAKAAWDGIASGAGTAGKIVSGIWNGVVGVVKAVWNAIAGVWNSIPSITVPDFVPVIGGQTFSMPKLPTMWHGGRVEYDAAIVGEQGPEPLINAAGRFAGMLGANGPELATGLPRGGYVVPNLDTLTRMPGLLKRLPSGVGSAVANAVPGYGDILGRRDGATPPPPPRPREDGGERRELARLAAAVERLADRPPPISASGDDVEDKVYRGLRKWEQRKNLSDRYSYGR